MKRRDGMCLVLWGLAVLMTNCEKEGALEGSGEKIVVNISLEDIYYKGNETVTRGDYSVAETVRVPLRDGVYMVTTIEENMEAPTRAGVALEDGVKVRVVAYNGTTAESTTEYTVANGALTTGTALSVNTGTSYTFVAYSYNSLVSPDYTEPTITVASPHDLIWGSETKPITALDNSVSITMNHKFAQVRVKATTTGISGQPNITDMAGVMVAPGNPVDLTIRTGSIGQNAMAATQSVSSWSGFGTTTATSAPIAVNTSTANPIYVDIGSATLVGYSPFTNLRATFNKALTVGISYTLVVNFKKTIFAGSNIYWVSTGGNDGYLTFDKGTSALSMCQGVFFKWGSLVGISPHGGTGQWCDFDNTVSIYKPASATTFTKTTTNAWSDIPKVSATGAYAGNYLLMIGNNWAAGTGDICNFIDGEYRMPVWDEWGAGPDAPAIGGTSWFNWDSSNPTTTPIAGGWTRIDDDWNRVSPTNDDGTTIIVSGASFHGTVFPAAGVRYMNNGMLTNDWGYSPGEVGVYFGGSAYDSSYGTGIEMLPIDLYFSGYNADAAAAVRCVKI